MIKSVLGQSSVLAALRESLRSDHLAQTYLFVGEHHIGKTTVAIALAKVLLCEKRLQNEYDSCDSCSACRTIDLGTNPDVRHAAPIGPSRMLRIAQFWPRDGVKDLPPDKALLRDLHFAPVSGKKRIYIVEGAESMNEDTANSLLKVLEEPPPYAVFILTATSTQAVLPTIVSRSQVLRFCPVAEPIIAQALIDGGSDPEKAAILSAYAQGRPGIAIRAAASPAVNAGRDEILDLATLSTSGRPTIEAFKIADELRKASSKLIDIDGGDNEPSARTLLTGACDIFLLWYRDLLVRKSTHGAGKVLNIDRSAVIDRHAARFTVDELTHAVDLVQDTKRYIGRNANGQLATEYLLLNLLMLGQSA
jgi:DNA polymerase-3 subunit delta'